MFERLYYTGDFCSAFVQLRIVEGFIEQVNVFLEAVIIFKKGLLFGDL